MTGKIKISNRIDSIQQNSFRELTLLKQKLLQQGIKFIDLSEGIPDLIPNQNILKKLSIYSSKPNLHSYPTRFGIDSLRRSVKDFFTSEFNVDIKDIGYIPTLGSKESVAHIHSAFIDNGDIVLIPELHYPFYSLSAQYYNAQVYEYQLDTDYQPILSSIPSKIASSAKIMWINYPHNPTGAIISEKNVLSIIEFCKKYNILLCSDMAYSHINFSDFSTPSILKYYFKYQNMIEIHSMSKNFSLPGWRIGFVLGNQLFINAIEKSKAVFDTGAFMVLQKTVAYALRQHKAIIPKIRNEYKVRSEFMYSKLLDLGFKVFKPDGTFYLWIEVPMDKGNTDYIQYLLQEKGILLLSGAMFGQKGKNFVRLSLTKPIYILEDVVEKLK